MSSLRQQINALPNSDQTNRIRLNKQLNAQQRELREDRVHKVNVQVGIEKVIIDVSIILVEFWCIAVFFTSPSSRKRSPCLFLTHPGSSCPLVNQRELDNTTDEKKKQATFLPIVQAALEILEVSFFRLH
jgi:hypothetical protein